MRNRVLTALVLCAMASPIGATVLIPASLAELSRDARIIARGHVVAVDGRWTDDRRTVETIVTLETEAYLKGQFGQTLQFRVPGGTLGTALLAVPPMGLVLVALLAGRHEQAGALPTLALGAILVVVGPLVYWIGARRRL